MDTSHADEPVIADVGSRLSLPAVVEYGERIGNHYAIYDPATGRADVAGLTERLGGRVAVGDGMESLDIIGANNFTIFIPSHTPPRRDRFTIAHELGHYFLHYRYLQQRHEPGNDDAARFPAPVRHFRRGGRDRTETEANWFASALLMPTEPFERAWKELDGDNDSVAAQFDVSPTTARIRAEALELPGT